jgi:hypothetical protein
MFAGISEPELNDVFSKTIIIRHTRIDKTELPGNELTEEEFTGDFLWMVPYYKPDGKL